MGHLVDHRADLIHVGEIAVEGVLAGRLGFPIGFDRPVVHALGEMVQPRRRLPTIARRSSAAMARTSTSLSMPCARSRAAVTGPTPHSASMGNPCRKRSTRSGAMTVSPSGFCQPEAILARNLFGATPADAVRASLADPGIQARGHGAPEGQRPGVVGDVEIGLVKGQGFDQRRSCDDRGSGARPRGAREVGTEEDRVGTEAHGERRHGRANAELARLVGGAATTLRCRRPATTTGWPRSSGRRAVPRRRRRRPCRHGRSCARLRIADCRLQIPASSAR